MKRIGYAGVFIIQTSYIPQIYQGFSTGQLSGVSPWFIFLVWLGLIMLQVYSYEIRDWVFILSNWLGLVSTSLLLIMLLVMG